MRKFFAIATVLLAATSVASADIAVTEFLNNAEGEDNGREWVELFNYSPNDVDLTGWTLVDEDTDIYTFGSVTIPSGGYIVVVSGGSGGLDEADAKAVFEQEWLGGVADPRVIGAAGMALGNSDDEIILRDASENIIWNVAYGNGENDNSTWLTVDDFSRTDWGTKAGVQIDREGDDLGIAGLVGYEHNDFALDPLAWTSDYEAIKDAGFLAGIGLAADYYDNVDYGSIGSPLTGHYTVIPEPATITFLGLGAIALIRRRR